MNCRPDPIPTTSQPPLHNEDATDSVAAGGRWSIAGTDAKVYQLAERWEKDCLAIKPDILTVMIGVNDFWHTLTNGYTGTAKTYRDDYIKLLTRTKDNFPDLHLIVMEPFGLKGVKAVDDKWYPSFLEYQQIAKEVAGHFDAAYIPLQDIFNQAAKTAEPAFWTRDGVHPTIPGSEIISSAWLSACV